MGLIHTVFLDACTIIYWVEANDPWYKSLQQTLHDIQQEHGQIRLAISDLSRLECLVKPLREQQVGTVTLYEKFFTHPQLYIQTLTSSVIQEALKLQVSHTLKTPDTLQAASALVLDPLCTFLTANSDFERISQLNVRLLK